jgi:hypothetical protein
MSDKLSNPVRIGILVILLIAIGLAIRFTVPKITNPQRTAVTTGVMYLLSVVGPCRGPTGYSPCFGGDDIDQAEVFNCAELAASPTGCTQLVANPSNSQISYEVTIWYPYVTHVNEPSWATCMYESSGDLGQQYFANCISTNSTAFIVTEPSPPPV